MTTTTKGGRRGEGSNYFNDEWKIQEESYVIVTLQIFRKTATILIVK